MNNFTRSKKPRIRKQRSGSIIVLTAVALVILLVFAALLVDVAWMSTIQTEAQLASDVSARGALTSFVSDRSDDSYDVRVARAQAIGETIFENITLGSESVDVDPTAFEFGVRTDSGDFSQNSNFANAVKVDLTNVKSDGFRLFLAPLFGVDNFNASPKSVVAYKPIDVVLCLDISRSMAWTVDANRPPASVGTLHAPPVEGSRWIALVDSVNLFLQKAEEQSPSLRISLITFGGGERKVVDSPWDEIRTSVQTPFDYIGTARGDIESKMNFITDNVLGWRTPTKEALELTQTNFAANSFDGVEKVTILLSDGRATTGTPRNAAAALAAEDATIHTIYFAGDPRGVGEMQSIADAGNGLALNADDEAELNEAFNQILALLSVTLVE
ncbi:VWA domain-containing protein [Mariniblastus sp.]|nr:VWA domain-containing protein [Mariniblastus sp.]